MAAASQPSWLAPGIELVSIEKVNVETNAGETVSRYNETAESLILVPGDFIIKAKPASGGRLSVKTIYATGIPGDKDLVTLAHPGTLAGTKYLADPVETAPGRAWIFKTVVRSEIEPSGKGWVWGLVALFGLTLFRRRRRSAA